MPPLGLLTVAAMMPQDWPVHLVDENIQTVKQEDMQWADVVFVSAMMVQKERFKEVVREAKAADCTVVAGGPYPTQYYEEIPEVDYFVLGEAESGTLPAFLEDWKNGTPKRAYVRHVIRNKPVEKEMDEAEWERLQSHFSGAGDLHCVESRPPMESSPTPRYELLDISAYGSMALQMSRGCPFSCDFCNEPALFGHTPRLKTAQRILDELQTFYDLGYRGSVFFVDDNFIGNIRKVRQVLGDIQRFQEEHEYPFSFYTEASLNLAENPELMAAMRDAGFNMVFVGIETTDASTLEKANKPQNADTDLYAQVRRIQEYGMEVTAGFIVGMDGEPDDICDQIYDFCQRAGIPTVMVGLLTPLRGSPLYERLQEEKRLIDEDICGNNTHSFGLHYVLDRGRDPEKLVEAYKDLLARLYPADGEAYFQRCRKMLEHIGETPHFSRRVHFTEVKALFKALFYQSMMSYRKPYWRLLGQSLRRKDLSFPEAVRLGITGHHFICITNYALEADRLRRYILQKKEYLQSLLASSKESGDALNIQFRDFIKEQHKTVKRIQKHIMKFPRDYQEELKQTYADLLERLNRVQEDWSTVNGSSVAG